MSFFQETKFLLQAHQIVPNKLLGQNFMVDSSVFPKLTDYVSLSPKDTVLDVGAGFGFLTRFLAPRCKQVIAVEKDPHVAEVLRKQVRGLTNVSLIIGDVLKVPLPTFNKVVTIPPYYISSHLELLLLDNAFDSAVLIVQKEFAERIVAQVNSRNYGWLAVVTHQVADAELLDDVPKWMFYPPPEVDSIILKLKPWKTPPFTLKNPDFFRRLTKWLFTQRNKKLGNALMPFLRTELHMNKAQASDVASTFSLRDKRIRELSPNEFGAIADGLKN